MSFVFQSDMQRKKKQHDTIDAMMLFSKNWERFPVLYNEKVCNALFATDWKNANTVLQRCYAELAADVVLSVSEVKARHVKYHDAVTKAVKQYGDDLKNGTTQCPSPAALKMVMFFLVVAFLFQLQARTRGWTLIGCLPGGHYACANQ